jgi:two-component system response regulator QseB
LVEDDLQLGSALQRSLTLAGLDAVWVRRLKDAASSLAALAPGGAVVLDINLPDGNGFSLLQELRAANNHVGVIVMTARADLADRLRGLDGGADDYIVKPFEVAELISRVRAVLRRMAGQSGPRWTIGALVVDSTDHTASLDGAPLNLTPLEYKLLLALATAAGRVVRREELIRAVWSSRDRGSDASLDFHLHALRRKLGAGRISTRRGIGYVLELE